MSSFTLLKIFMRLWWWCCFPESFYFLWFLKKSFLVLVFHFHGNHIPQLSSDSWFLITFKMRYWEADLMLCYKSEIPHVAFTLKWYVKAFPWGVTQHQYLYVFSLGLIRFSKEIMFWSLTWSVETRILETVWIKWTIQFMEFSRPEYWSV